MIVGKVSVSLERSLKETALKDGSLTERQSLFCGIFCLSFQFQKKDTDYFRYISGRGPILDSRL